MSATHKTKYNTFLSTPSEGARLREIAVKHGLSLSDFVRTAICTYAPGALSSPTLPRDIKMG